MNSPADQRKKRQATHWSPTRLRTFVDCPKRYDFAYLQRPTVKESPSAALVLGEALHKALAFFLRQEAKQRELALVHDAFRHFWAGCDRKDVFHDDTEEREWGTRGLIALEHFCATEDLAVTPEMIEGSVRARLPNDSMIVGKVDRVDRVMRTPKNPTMEVIDYKSGRCRVPEDGLGEDIGAQLYAIAVADTYNLPTVAVRFLFLTEEIERRWEPDADELAQRKSELGQLIDRVDGTETFEPQPGPICGWCPYLHLCPAGEPVEIDALDQDAVPF